jgi:UDP:flavonoid glycosyltransferase YjiC (YdhE family)
VIAAVAAGADVVLTAFGASPLSRTVAEGFGIPSVGAYLLPGVPTAQFPLPGSPEPDLGPEGNLVAGREMLRRAGELYGDVLSAVRARLDLPTVATPHSTGAPDGWPICHGYSPLVVPRPADWPAEVHVTGYWWPAVPIGWQPPRELVDFLQAGGATVFIGFGSMVPQARESLSELVAAAVRRADVRAVVQTGWADLAAHTDDILLIGDVPHEWLFPQMAAVVHHAGAGTTAAGLRAGVPAVAVPVLLDQPFWAARLHRLGVSPDPLLQRELTADALAAAIRTCVDDAGYRERAADVARRIRAEDGTAAALEVVNEATG